MFSDEDVLGDQESKIYSDQDVLGSGVKTYLYRSVLLSICTRINMCSDQYVLGSRDQDVHGSRCTRIKICSESRRTRIRRSICTRINCIDMYSYQYVLVSMNRDARIKMYSDQEIKMYSD
jgi:hypothetical protein